MAPLGPLVRLGDVGDDGVHGHVHDGASAEHGGEEVEVGDLHGEDPDEDQSDGIHDEPQRPADHGDDEEGLPPEAVREGPGQDGDDNPGDGGGVAVPEVEVVDVDLHLVLVVVVLIFLDVVADRVVELHAHHAGL